MNTARKEAGRGFPWKNAGVAFALVGTSYLVAVLGLSLAGVHDAPTWFRHDAAGFVLAAILAIFVAVSARRHGEKAHPWQAFLAVWVAWILFGRLVDRVRDWA